MSERERNGKDSGVIFLVTLLLWLVSVLHEILFNGKQQLVVILCSCFFFKTANWVLKSGVSKDGLFVNTCVSLLHSSLTSISVLLIVINAWTKKGPEGFFSHDELVDGIWFGGYSTLCFSCGYFAYDQWDLLRNHHYSGWFPAILVHHLVLLVCFTLALYRNITINYLILTLICELHSVFLHTRKVRRMAGMRDGKSKAVQMEWVLNWATFLVARLACHLLITCKLIVDASKFRRGIELPLALFGILGMNVLNIFLGRDLFIAYRREQREGNHHIKSK